MENGRRTHVDGKLTQVRVKLTRETQVGGDTGHDKGHQVVKITVGGGGELERPEADVVKSLVIDTEGLVGVLHKLVDGESGVVGLHKIAISGSQMEDHRQSRTSTTVSDTLGDGTTENVHIIRSGYSSLILEIKRVPIPAPVPPPREWVIWKPERT